MEGEVAAEIRIEEGIVFLVVLIGGIYGFHTHIKPQNEIAEVQTQANTICHSYLLIELVKLELAAWLLCIRPQSPDISCIYECRTIELPKQEGAVLRTQVKLHVTSLIDEVNSSISSSKLSRTKFSHTPSSYRVGTTSKVPFLKW